MTPLAHPTAATLDFNPGYNVSLIGQQLTVNVTVSNVVDLSSLQLALAFNPEILNCTGLWGWNASDGFFAGHDVFTSDPVIDNAIGRITTGCALIGQIGVSGSGKLCTVQFRVLSLGVSTLKLVDVMSQKGTYLLDPVYNIIPFVVNVGVVEAVASGFTQNSFNVTQNMQTFTVGIRTNSTVTDFYFNSSYKELSYNATASDGTAGASIVTVPKALLNGTLLALVDNVPIREYASAMGTLPENETCSFTYFTYPQSTRNIKIRLTLTGDLNGDRIVDIRDVALVARAYGTMPGSPRWTPLADLDNNHIVDIRDIAYVSKNYGSSLKM
jgi:hypothetical protein